MKDADVLVIGGGILGAGVAQCAAASGYSVVLIDKSMVACATSANSSKLIHGGLRYLETAQIKLVYESLSERAYLIHHAAELVKPIKFYIPVYRSSKRKPWQLFCGLSLYSILSGFHKLGRFKKIPKHLWSSVSEIKQDGLVALFQYWDAQTDDKQLTLSVIESAKSMGVTVFEHCNCTSVIKQEEGYQVETEYNGDQTSFRAKCVINATGPWGAEVLKKVTPAVKPLDVELVFGSHVLLDIPSKDHILYIESHIDSRVIFVMPWYGKTLVGTTEHSAHEAPSEFHASEKEIDYLCQIYAHYFHAFSSSELRDLLVKTFCGARVLPNTSSNPFRRSRETIMKSYPEHSHLLNILGGKLTTYRVTAKQTVSWIEKRLGGRTQVADFDKIKLFRKSS